MSNIRAFEADVAKHSNVMECCINTFDTWFQNSADGFGKDKGNTRTRHSLLNYAAG